MTEPQPQITEVDPRADDVRELIGRHLQFTGAASPAEYAFALDHDRIVDPNVTLFGLRAAGRLVAIGALKHLDPTHAELKSMHTAQEVRGQGLGRSMLTHLIGTARERGYRRLSLETGSTHEFAPARGLYAANGFVSCAAFGDYKPSEWNTFMCLDL